MKHILLRSLAGAGLLVFGLTAYAQDRDRDRDRDRNHDEYQRSRDGYFRGDNWRAHFFQRIREDLDHVQSATFPVSRDEFRIARTKQELNELQEKMAAGRYDQPELDEVIGALQRVVSDNRLSPRDRDVLNDDLNRLREYREHHDTWGR